MARTTVYVTSVQRLAAQAIMERDAAKGRPTRASIIAIANARRATLTSASGGPSEDTDPSEAGKTTDQQAAATSP